MGLAPMSYLAGFNKHIEVPARQTHWSEGSGPAEQVTDDLRAGGASSTERESVDSVRTKRGRICAHFAKMHLLARFRESLRNAVDRAICAGMFYFRSLSFKR